MPRIALLLEYAGGSFNGSQTQAGMRTVQTEIEKALSTVARVPIKVTFAGRTDSGVHAAGQVIHFDLDPNLEIGGSDNLVQKPGKPIDMWRLVWSLNGICPDDLSVVAGQIVLDDFHARFGATERAYVYKILNRPQRSALLKDTHYFIPFSLDTEAMGEAAKHLLGSHDFTAFRSTSADRTNPVCKVTRSELLILGEGRLEFWIAADHFVYNMVRIIVGTLVEIGLGKKSAKNLIDALESDNRDLAGPTAPPWGLTLNSVKYPENYKLSPIEIQS